MKTRIFTLIMSLFVATMVFAYDAEIDGIYYNLDAENKTAEVTSGDEYYMGDIVIPSSIVSNGVTYSVTSIGAYAFSDYSLRGLLHSISIPNTIVSIGSGAFLNNYEFDVYISDIFAWCKIEFKPETTSTNPLSLAETLYLNNEKVTTLVIPEGVDTIKSHVFQGAPISSFVFPESLVYVAEDAFSGSIWWENLPQGSIYAGKVFLKYVDYGEDYVGEKETHIDIKEGTKTIADCAFINCSSLESVTIPNSVTKVGGGVFYGCSNLKSVVLSENMTSLPIGNKKDYWGGSYNYGFFEGCSSLTSIEIPNSVTSIGDRAFCNCSSLTSITIPNSVTSIGDIAFYNCSFLTSITIPNSVTAIGNYAFSECSSLTSITIPNSVTEIGDEAFSGCIGLTSIEIPNSVIYLGDEAFANCWSLRYAKLGSGIKEIGERIFYCNGIYDEETDEYISFVPPFDTLICEFGEEVVLVYEEDVYENYTTHPLTTTKNLRYFEGPAKLVNTISEGIQTQFSNKLTEVHITDGELDENGFNYINRSKKSLHTIDLAGTTNTAINDLAFYDCYKLENLMLPGNLETIGFKAVAECYQLKEINIPASVVEINDAAFENCRSIKSITFGGQAEAKSFASRMKRAAASGDVALQRIGNWAFYNCHALENLVIPEGVTEVGDAAFYGCTYLDSLALPSTTQRIGDNCFALCSRMKQINVNATVPPTIFAKTFFDVNRNIPVIVPEGAREAYANDEYWGEFINVVESDDVDTQIENAENANVAIYSVGGVLYVDGLSADYQVFDVNGRLVYTGRDVQLSLPRGVYVVNVGGEVEKVVI